MLPRTTPAGSHKPRLSIATWLMLAVLATVTCAVAAALLLVERFAREDAERQAGKSLRQIAWSMRDALDRGMEERVEAVRLLSAMPSLAQSHDAVELRALLDRFHDGFQDFAWLGLTDTQGTVRSAVDGLLEGKNVSARPWFAGARQSLYVGDVHAALLLEKLLPQQSEPWRFVDIAMPIAAADGHAVGVLGAHLSWSWARRVRDRLLDPALASYQAEVLVLDRNGVVIMGPPGSEGTRLPIDRYAATTRGVSNFVVEPAGDDRLFTAVAETHGLGRFPGLGWQVLVRQSESVALADYRRLRDQIVAAGLALAVLFALVSQLVADRLAWPLKRLARALDGSPQADSLPTVGVYREAARLGDALRDLLNRQQRHADELRTLNASLEVRIEQRSADLVTSHKELAGVEQRLRAIADNLPGLVSYVDAEERLQFCNQTFVSWLGIDPADAIGQPVASLTSAERYAVIQPWLERALNGERVQYASELTALGLTRQIETVYVPHVEADGRVAGLYALSTDVSALKAVEQQLQALARVDTLTQLPNRYEFNQRLPQALARARRTKSGVALLFLDVDHFKKINDAHGHAVGDAVLKAFAQRVKASVRTTDTVARLAGDEFIVLLEGMNAQDEPKRVAQKIVTNVCRPREIGGSDLGLSTSVGIAFDATGSMAPEELLARADEALYAAKRAGRATYRMSDFEAAVV